MLSWFTCVYTMLNIAVDACYLNSIELVINHILTMPGYPSSSALRTNDSISSGLIARPRHIIIAVLTENLSRLLKYDISNSDASCRILCQLCRTSRNNFYRSWSIGKDLFQLTSSFPM